MNLILPGPGSSEPETIVSYLAVGLTSGNHLV